MPLKRIDAISTLLLKCGHDLLSAIRFLRPRLKPGGILLDYQGHSWSCLPPFLLLRIFVSTPSRFLSGTVAC